MYYDIFAYSQNDFENLVMFVIYIQKASIWMHQRLCSSNRLDVMAVWKRERPQVELQEIHEKPRTGYNIAR